MPTALFVLAMLVFASPALAQAPPEGSGSATTGRGPYVSFNMGVELHALEQAAQDTAQATKDLASAVRAMAASPSLTEEQKAQIMTVAGRVDSLSARAANTLDRLPEVVRESRDPMVAIAKDLAAQVRLTIIVVIALLLVLVLGVLWGTYAFALRPARKLLAGFTDGFQSMARSLERSAELVGEANAVQLELAKTLKALRATPDSKSTL